MELDRTGMICGVDESLCLGGDRKTDTNVSDAASGRLRVLNHLPSTRESCQCEEQLQVSKQSGDINFFGK